MSPQAKTYVFHWGAGVVAERKGRFQLSPLLVSAEDVDGLREALKKAPKLKKLLSRLVQD